MTIPLPAQGSTSWYDWASQVDSQGRGASPKLNQRTSTVTANATANTNEIVPLDTTGGTFTLTGPTGGGVFGARWKAGSAAPTIAAPSGYTIAGAASITLTLAPVSSSGEVVVWQAFGTDYQAVGGNKPQAAMDTRNDARYASQAALDGKVPIARTVTAGTGLTGGGDLSANRILTVSYGTTSGTAAAGDDSRITGAVPKSLIDAKGDLFAGASDDTPARVAVGSNGQVLTADSTAAPGVSWQTPSGSSGDPMPEATTSPRTSAVSGSALLGKTNRADTTGGTFSQPAPLSVADGRFRWGWTATVGTTSIPPTLTSDTSGSPADVFLLADGTTATSVQARMPGQMLTFHAQITGTGQANRWLITEDHRTQAALDARFAPVAKPTFATTPREVYDLSVTSASAAVTSVTAAFTAADVGALISGLNIPVGTTIASVQSATQATMSANATGTNATVTATIGSLGVATPAAIYTARTPGRVVNIIGDSIAPQQNAAIGFMGSDGAVSTSSGNSLMWAHLLSDGQLIMGKQAGIGSQRIEHMLQRLYNDILPFPAQFCCIQTGTNDASAGTTVATWASYIRQMCAALHAAGQTPVLITPPPVIAAYRPLADKYRRWLIAFALRGGFPLVDAYAALAATDGTGGYATGFDSGDGTHPNVAGYRAYGQAIVDALAGHLLPGRPLISRGNAAANHGGMLDNGLFLLDANADGVPDGWTKTGAGGATPSIVTGDSAIVGNALRLVDTANTGSTTLTTTTTATVPVGGRFAFTGRIKIAGNGAARLTAYLATAFPGQGRVVYASTAFGGTDVLGGWKRFYLEVPNNTAAARTVTVELTAPGAVDTDVSIAQIGVHDLSGLSL